MLATVRDVMSCRLMPKRTALIAFTMGGGGDGRVGSVVGWGPLILEGMARGVRIPSTLSFNPSSLVWRKGRLTCASAECTEYEAALPSPTVNKATIVEHGDRIAKVSECQAESVPTQRCVHGLANLPTMVVVAAAMVSGVLNIAAVVSVLVSVILTAVVAHSPG
jgi:hypothetical protein